MDRDGLRYAACYCEENVWHLAVDPRIPEPLRYAVFISNAARCCPVWAQRSAPGPGVPAMWDYHVVLVATAGPSHLPVVYDLDTALSLPVPLAEYLAESFPLAGRLEPELEPRFRVVEAAELRARFASDRSHMRTGEGWSAPPPSWPPIHAGAEVMNLDRFLDMEDGFAGELLDLDGLRARFLAAGGAG